MQPVGGSLSMHAPVCGAQAQVTAFGVAVGAQVISSPEHALMI